MSKLNVQQCEHCAARFTAYRSKVRRFCSRSCASLAQLRHSPAARTELFWSKVDKNGPVPAHRPELGPCWLWTASTATKGYGQFMWGTAVAGTHRIAWLLTFGRWPEPCCLHHCDNPRCVRPDHLFEGTHADNIADMFAKGRQPSRRGALNGRSKQRLGVHC